MSKLFLHKHCPGLTQVQVVNTLGLKSDGAPLYAKLESGSLSDADVDPNCTLSASQYAAFHASPCPLCNMSHDMLYYYEYRAICASIVFWRPFTRSQHLRRNHIRCSLN